MIIVQNAASRVIWLKPNARDEARRGKRVQHGTQRESRRRLQHACSALSSPLAPSGEEYESDHHRDQHRGESNQGAPLDSETNDQIAVLLDVCAHAAERKNSLAPRR